MTKPTDQEREAFALIPVERSYDMRAAAILHFNTAWQAGDDLDDALDKAWRATLSKAHYPDPDPDPDRAQQPAGVAVPALNKTREQWQKVDPKFCAEKNSPAANMHLIKDEQRDIERLHRALNAAPHPVSGEQQCVSEDVLEECGLGYPLSKEKAVELWHSGIRSEPITDLEAWQAIGHETGCNPSKDELIASLRNMAAICYAHGCDMPATQDVGGLGYQVIFDAIAAATRVSAEKHVAISVEAFQQSIAARRAQQDKP